MASFNIAEPPTCLASLTTAPDTQGVSNGRLFSRSIAVDARMSAGRVSIEVQRSFSNVFGSLIPFALPTLAVSFIIAWARLLSYFELLTSPIVHLAAVVTPDIEVKSTNFDHRSQSISSVSGASIPEFRNID